ncbi:MAG: radical SAM protein [Endomicrobiales bacterium]
MIPYSGTVIRPPSEAESLIFQVTLGCSDNGCVFCPAYKDKKFSIKALSVIEAEMRRASEAFPDTRRIFLADGDALAAGPEVLRSVCAIANRYFPKLTRIATYGSAKSIELLSVADLQTLHLCKLSMVYIGFETGDPLVYASTRKYGSPQKNIEACQKVKAAGLTANVTVILGLGGKKFSHDHAVNTALLLNEAQPDQIAVLTLMIAHGTPLETQVQRGTFSPLKTLEFLAELKLMLENIKDFRCIFLADHASNYLPVRARFPRGRNQLIYAIGSILSAGDPRLLVSECRRSL